MQVATYQQRLSDRLRCPPSGSTVPGSLPVLFFGDLFRAEIVTVGLNPSWQEYWDKAKRELDGKQRRFQTQASLGVKDRKSLEQGHVECAIETMRGYFDAGKPVYSQWFPALTRVVSGLGCSFEERTAAHLDLVQEATYPPWSELRKTNRTEYDDLLERDLPFLQWQIETFPIRLVVCTSKTVLGNVMHVTRAETVRQGTMARLQWTIAVAKIDGRRVGIAGWNIPLARPTGLTRDGQVELGRTLREQLCHAGVDLA